MCHVVQGVQVTSAAIAACISAAAAPLRVLGHDVPKMRCANLAAAATEHGDAAGGAAPEEEEEEEEEFEWEDVWDTPWPGSGDAKPETESDPAKRDLAVTELRCASHPPPPPHWNPPTPSATTCDASV